MRQLVGKVALRDVQTFAAWYVILQRNSVGSAGTICIRNESVTQFSRYAAERYLFPATSRELCENRRRADTRGCSTPRAPLSGNLGTPAAIQPDGPSAHRRRLLTASIGLRSVRPLTTGLERVRLGAAAQRPTARCAGCERSRPRSAGREHTGADCAPREIGRPRTPVLHRPSACSCERRWRRGGTRVGSLPNLPVWAGLRRA